VGVGEMFKRMLTSIGIGNAKVDTVIPNQSFLRGNRIQGEVKIEGGIASQKIDAIILTLFVKFEEIRGDSDFSVREKEVQEIVINICDIINVGQHMQISFSIDVALDHPITNHQNETFLRTTLVIPQGVDVFDEDTIIIK
jgi:sporulation-control protein